MKHIFTILLSIILLGTSPACTLEQEAYAVMSPDSTTLTFYYDTKKSSRQGTAYEINAEDSILGWIKWVTLLNGRYEYPENSNFTTVVFDESFKDARPLSCAYWFAGFRNLTKIEGISNLNTSNVTDMFSMFKDCESLTSIDVRNFNTSNVTDMHSMFEGCIKLTTLDVSNFNTSNVTDMHSMFNNCQLTNIDLSKFNTSKVTNMNSMFCYCWNLTSIDLSRFDTSNVTDMSFMFYRCEILTELDLSKFSTSNVTHMRWMFMLCKKLKTIYIGDGWNTSNVDNSEEMFDDCTLSKYIKSISQVENSDKMFEDCHNLVGGKGTKYNSKVIDITRAKIDGGKENPGYLTAKK